jgi:two-component sensor histidine kinase
MSLFKTGTLLSIVLMLVWPSWTKADKIKDYKTISSLLQEGIQAVIKEDVPSSHSAFEKAYTMAKEKGYDDLIAVITVSQSRLFALENDFDKVLANLLKVENYFTKDTMSSLAGDYHEYIAQCYLQQNKLPEALIALHNSERIRQRIEPSKNWRTYNGMARIYHKLKQHDVAEEYSKKAEKLAKIQNSKKVLLDLQTELTFDEKDGTIAILSKENKRTKVDLQKSKYRTLFLGVGALLLGLLSLFLYIILRQRSRLNKEMYLRNELISKNLEEKEYLIKEIHHRVKNNLQVISSLLSLQSRSVDDKQAIDALNESQSRVISMSLIHQNLYKDGSSSHLDVKNYLQNLTQNLFNTYNINSAKIKLVLDVDELDIDVGHLVPLGLIVNELITNSLKYAFHNRAVGTIGLSCKRNGEGLYIKVWDDGIGATPITNNEGFGSRLINTFAKRLNAEIKQSYDNGTQIELIVNDYKKAV